VSVNASHRFAVSFIVKRMRLFMMMMTMIAEIALIVMVQQNQQTN
jgi:hypothetical protein